MTNMKVGTKSHNVCFNSKTYHGHWGKTGWWQGVEHLFLFSI